MSKLELYIRPDNSDAITFFIHAVAMEKKMIFKNKKWVPSQILDNHKSVLESFGIHTDDSDLKQP